MTGFTRKDCMFVLVVLLGTYIMGRIVLTQNKMNIFEKGDLMTLWEDRLTSGATLHPLSRVDSLVIDAFGDTATTGDGGHITDPSLTFAEQLMGQQIFMTDMSFFYRSPESCLVTHSAELTPELKSFYQDLIGSQYQRNLYLDGLPLARYGEKPNGEVIYSPGVEVGMIPGDVSAADAGRAVLFNYYSIKVRYHREVEGHETIVGIEVVPGSHASSQATSANDWCSRISSSSYMYVDDASQETKVYFGYNIEWVNETSVSWKRRVNHFLRNDDSEIQVFSSINTAVMTFFILFLCGAIYKNYVHKEMGYQKLEEEEGGDDQDIAIDRKPEERASWPALSGDVWRPPMGRVPFSVVVGFGMQLFYAVLVTFFYGMSGWLNAFSHGAVLTGVMVAFLGTSMLGGLHSMRMYQMAEGNSPMKVLNVTAIVPAMALFLAFSALVFTAGTWNGKAVTGLFLYFLAVIVFSAIGSYYGAKTAAPYKFRYNGTARAVPGHKSALRHPLIWRALVSVFVFASVFIQMFFVLESVVFGRLYFAFGWMVVAWLLMALNVVLLSLMSLIERLNGRQDHRWWWGTFFDAGCTGLVMFGYSIVFYMTRMSGGGLVFLVGSAVFSICLSVIVGGLAVHVSSLFMRRLYGKGD